MASMPPSWSVITYKVLTFLCDILILKYIIV
jgi:hypothetical protein